MSFNKIWPSFWVSILNFWGWWWNFTGAYFLNGCFNHQQAIACVWGWQNKRIREGRTDVKPHDFISYAIHAWYIYLHSLSKTTKYKLIYMDGTGVGRVSAFCAIQRTKRKRKMFHVFFSCDVLTWSTFRKSIRGDPGRKKTPARRMLANESLLLALLLSKGGTYIPHRVHVYPCMVYLPTFGCV